MKKIEQSELDTLKTFNKSVTSLKFKIADIEFSKKILLEELDLSGRNLAKYQEELTAKYGDITVNLHTGEYN
jgi:hypothetical protein